MSIKQDNFKQKEHFNLKMFFSTAIMFLSISCIAAEEKQTELPVKKSKIQETVLGMNVSGNKEAPNILYIIPWKDSTEHSKPPEINLLMDEVFSTVDPDVYEKELGFYQQLTEANSQQKINTKE